MIWYSFYQIDLGCQAVLELLDVIFVAKSFGYRQNIGSYTLIRLEQICCVLALIGGQLLA